MLKIIDNISLKELTKYGFERPLYVKQYIKVVKNSRYTEEDTIYEVDIPSRKIRVWGKKINLDLLFDLQKDGLVEKVDE